MEVKYQIFISSTYEDLKDERQTVIKACLEMGHIPVGMEMFSAADDEQWEIIKRQIDQSDYYVVIVAHRYGSLSGVVSYTEKEYDYAVAQGVPVLAFIIDDNTEWSPKFIESAAAQEIAAFKAKLRDRPVDWWRSKDELHSKCAIALMKAFNTRPRPGWIRASEFPGPHVADELSRLSSENAALRTELGTLRTRDVSELSQDDDMLEVRFRLDEGLERKDFTWKTSWNQLFVEVGHATLSYPEEDDVRNSIKYAFFVAEVNDPALHWDWFKLLNGDWERIKRQFVALDLIEIDFISQSFEEPEFLNRTGKTNLTSKLVAIWKLTKNGTDKYTALAAQKRIQKCDT